MKISKILEKALKYGQEYDTLCLGYKNMQNEILVVDKEGIKDKMYIARGRKLI